MGDVAAAIVGGLSSDVARPKGRCLGFNSPDDQTLKDLYWARGVKNKLKVKIQQTRIQAYLIQG